MIKKIIKIILITFLTLIVTIIYLSIFGIKTNKFNNQISSNISKIDKRINLNISEVNYLLNPYDFTINVKTKNPQILLEGRSLKITDIQTNVSLNALINDEFLIDDLKITSKENKLNEIIALVRVFKNTPQLFVLNTIIDDGFVTANIDLNFDKKGKIKEDYKIEGFVKKVKLNILNQYKLQNLSFNFDINKNNYSFKQVETRFNKIEVTSPLIEIKKKRIHFL